MEWPTFTLLPDFTEDPEYTYDIRGQNTALSAAETRVSFPQLDGPTQAWKFDFAFFSRSAIAETRAFMDAIGGRHAAFLLPSWTDDLTLVGATAGIGEITVGGNGYADDLADVRPDTTGRYVWIWSPGMTDAQIYQVSRAENIDGSTQTLYTEELLLRSFDPADGAVMGFANVVRFVADSFRWRQTSASTARINLGFRTTRRRRTQAQTTPLTPVPFQISLGFESAAQTDETVDIVTQSISYAEGPENLHLTQDAQYTRSWAAWVDSAGAIRIKKSDPGDFYPPANAEGQVSILADQGITPAGQISLAFDQTAYESVAFQYDEETVEIRSYYSGAAQKFQFPGTSPVVFYNGLLDVEGQGDGTTDIICYYVKRFDPRLFYRLQRDQYTVEYSLAIPVAPFSLAKAYREGKTEVLEGFDHSMRRFRLVSPEYPDPPVVAPSPYVEIPRPPEATTATISLMGTATQLVFDPRTQEESAAPSVTLAGTYVSGIVEGIVADIPEGAETGITLAGTYVSGIVTGGTDPETSPVTVTLDGAYTETVVRPPGDTSEASTTGIALGGEATQRVFDPRTKSENSPQSISLTGTYTAAA